MDSNIQVFSDTPSENGPVNYLILIIIFFLLGICHLIYILISKFALINYKSSTMTEEIEDPFCLRDNPITITLEMVQKAKERIGDAVVYTPCTKSHIGTYTQTELYVKKEFLQFTGSFKERGARNCMLAMDESKKAAGVIASSAGNHALGIAYHGLLLGIAVTVVMPITAPLMKVQKCKKLKANVVLEGTCLAEAKAWAMKESKEKGMMYINGYDHPDILAGAGTIGLEILEQVPDVEAVIVPVGGGGLISGIAAAIKGINPCVKIIGVESEICPTLTKSLESGEAVKVECGQSLADGLSVALIGYNSFDTIKRHLDKMVVVKEEMVAMAILAIIELEKSVVEGAGATPIAALLSGVLPDLKGKKVVGVLSGGNIDSTVLGRVMDRGLAVLGRLIKFSVVLKDKAGGISDLLNKLADIGVSVKDVIHDRAWVINDVFSVEVTVICETRGIDHALELKELLDETYKNVDYSYFPNACTAKIIGL